MTFHTATKKPHGCVTIVASNLWSLISEDLLGIAKRKRG